MTRTMKPRFDRVLALSMAVVMAFCMMITSYAGAEETIPIDVSTETHPAGTTATPAPTEVPMENTSPYKVTFTVPNDWTGDDSANVKIQISYLSSMAATKVEYKQSGKWIDVTEKLNTNVDGNISIPITANGALTVRITDPHGHAFTEQTQIDCFDWSAPSVNAGINGEKLRIVATDTQSGVAGVQVNGLLFTTLDDGEISIIVKDVLSKYEHLAVRAFDYAGNFSEPVTLDNPYYEAPATPTPIPTNTPKPTKTPASGSAESTATAIPTATAVNTATAAPISGSVVYVPEWTASTITAAPVVTPTPQVIYETITETEYITLGPGMPFQSDGNAHTLDMLYSAATNKQFISVQTKSGNTFYLVIDYDKPVDEDAEMYETYFLNLVDERDLMALLSDEEKEAVPTATPQIVYVTPQPTTAPVPTAEPTGQETKKTDQSTAIIALVAILAIGGIAAFLFIKNKNGSTKRKPDNDFGLDDDEEDESEQNT